MNRVKRTSRLYEEARPDITKLRERNRAATVANKAKFKGRKVFRKREVVDLEEPETNQLMDYTKDELKRMAKRAGLKGYSKLRKDDLVRLLS